MKFHPYADKFPMLPKGHRYIAHGKDTDGNIAIAWFTENDTHPNYFDYTVSDVRNETVWESNKPVSTDVFQMILDALLGRDVDMKWQTEMVPVRDHSPRTRQYVYFIADESGYVKIGVAGGTPDSRLSSLQTGNREQLTLIGHVPGGLDKEKELHGKFSRDWVRGEWFRLSPAIRSYISEVSQ